MLRAAEDVNLLDFITRCRAASRSRCATRQQPFHRTETAHQFARALSHNPRILILDEATSSVDTDTELRVRSALERMVVGRTSVVIAHRLSTVQRAEHIIVMHKGQLREMGTHQELLARRGIYWKLTSFNTRTRSCPSLLPLLFCANSSREWIDGRCPASFYRQVRQAASTTAPC